VTLSPRRALAQFRAILHFDDPPWRLALSLAIGVFISFTPFYGLQTLLSIALALVLRLNRAATVAGTWINLPWFAPLVYAGALKIGTLVVPDPQGTRGAWLAYLLERPGSLSWQDLPVLLNQMSLPLLVGTTVLGGLAGIVTYILALGLIVRHRARRRQA
jgi:uncharacterized protein (DUF2062 family)